MVETENAENNFLLWGESTIQAKLQGLSAAVHRNTMMSHTTSYAGRRLRSDIVATTTCEMGQ